MCDHTDGNCTVLPVKRSCCDGKDSFLIVVDDNNPRGPRIHRSERLLVEITITSLTPSNKGYVPIDVGRVVERP